jgi:hypothetical protein
MNEEQQQNHQPQISIMLDDLVEYELLCEMMEDALRLNSRNMRLKRLRDQSRLVLKITSRVKPVYHVRHEVYITPEQAN